MARINVQLEALYTSSSTHNVCLQFDIPNAAYYLDLVKRSPGDTAARALRKAKAAETAAQAALAPYAAVPAKPAVAMPAPRGGEVKVTVKVPPGVTAGETVQIEVAGVGPMAVQVPPGLTEGQEFPVQVPLPVQVAEQLPAERPVAMQMQNR